VRNSLLSTGIVALLVGLGVAAGAEVLPSLGRAAAALAGATALLLVTALVTLRVSERRMWLYGWRKPGGARWIVPAAFAALLAIPLRGVFPAPKSLAPDAVALTLISVGMLALALEACFRGLAYGLLLRYSRLPGPDDPARITYPAAISALLYAAAATALCAPGIWGQFRPTLAPVEDTALVFLAAIGGGLLLARVRERSLSIWPGAVAQLLGGIASAGLALLIPG